MMTTHCVLHIEGEVYYIVPTFLKLAIKRCYTSVQHRLVVVDADVVVVLVAVPVVVVCFLVVVIETSCNKHNRSSQHATIRNHIMHQP